MKQSLQSTRHADLANVLRAYREAAGLSQSELAAKIDEPQSFVSKYEGGVRRLDLVELEQVAVALGVTLTELVRAFEAQA